MDIFKLLRPPHPLDDAKEGEDLAYHAQVYEARVRGWRWRINNTILVLVGFATLVILAVAPTGLPLLGQLAWANDTDQKIEKAVAPLQAKIDSIAAQTKQIKDQQNARELADLRQKLFETRIAQCKARKGRGGDNPYSVRMAELQSQHFMLTGAYYVAAECEDL